MDERRKASEGSSGQEGVMPPARLASATAAGCMIKNIQTHTFTVSAPLCICSLYAAAMQLCLSV